MAKTSSARSLRMADLRVSADDHPGWVLASERTPSVGEQVYCAGGEGHIASLHGKTGDGSRLLQIRLNDENTQPYFAAASNVLVRDD